MEVKVLDRESIDREIAEEMIHRIHEKENCVLGLATGSSPLGVYRRLCDAYRRGEVSFRNVVTFNLDEYKGLKGSHPQSYRFFMNRHLFDHIDIRMENTHFPNNDCEEKDLIFYDEAIRNAGGIDFQILGIGSNGHIAFNEPGTPFDTLTHTVLLKESTIRDNSRFFNSVEEVPTQAVSMGLASIMKARRIVLIAIGFSKAEAIRKLIEGETTSALPASILKTHPDVTVYCDEAAASLIRPLCEV